MTDDYDAEGSPLPDSILVFDGNTYMLPMDAAALRAALGEECVADIKKAYENTPKRTNPLFVDGDLAHGVIEGEPVEDTRLSGTFFDDSDRRVTEEDRERFIRDLALIQLAKRIARPPTTVSADTENFVLYVGADEFDYWQAQNPRVQWRQAWRDARLQYRAAVVRRYLCRGKTLGFDHPYRLSKFAFKAFLARERSEHQLNFKRWVKVVAKESE